MEIHVLRSRNNNLYWKNCIAKDVYKVDTAFATRDSIKVNYFSKNGLVIKMERLLYNEENCKTYSTAEYYDRNMHLVYVEYWNFNCSTEMNPNPNDYVINEYLSRYDRMEYDTFGRLILAVIYLSTLVTFRIKYHYDQDNQRHSVSDRIKENEFWEYKFAAADLTCFAIGCRNNS